ncbi:MAG TPA: aminoglycoside 6'-N-acetyltransferase [Prosthecobacter sp.]
MKKPKQALILGACGPADCAAWAQMRHSLWPESSAEDHASEVTSLLSKPEGYAVFLVKDGRGSPVGFVEVSLRYDYVNGTQSSPVAFVEGLYVEERWRRRGVARLLIEAVFQWAKIRGCTELASDALLENTESHEAHKALGFEETERVVYFRKQL